MYFNADEKKGVTKANICETHELGQLNPAQAKLQADAKKLATRFPLNIPVEEVRGVASFAPQCSGGTSATFCEKVQRCPSGSSALYCRTPNGMSCGELMIRAPAAFACSKCRSTSSTVTCTYWETSPARGARVLGPLPPEHDGAVGDDKLGMKDDAAVLDAQALHEAEGVAEPRDRLDHVGVDQYRDDGRGGCRLILNHGRLLTKCHGLYDYDTTSHGCHGLHG